MSQFILFPSVGGGAGSDGTPGLETEAGLEIYVAANGSDAGGNGTQANPYLTIQKAIDTLPPFINHPVTIYVGAGNFAGFVVDARIYRSIRDNGGSLTIRGTYQLATLATGLNTGTIVSGVAGSSTSWGTFSVTAAGWTTDDLRGRLVLITAGLGSGQIRPIQKNTNANPGVATILGAWTTTPTGATYQIVESATVINAVAPNVAGATYSVYLGANTGGDDGLGSAGSKYAITLERLRFTTTANGIQASSGTKVRLQNNEFRCTTVNVTFAAGGGRALVQDNVFGPNNGTGLNVLEGWVVTGFRNSHNGDRTGVILNNATSNNESNAIYYESSHHYNSLDFGMRFAVGSGQLVGSILERSSLGATAIDCGDTSPGAVKIFTCTINTWTTGITCSGPACRHVFLQGSTTGTGNTTAVKMLNGTNCKVNSTVNVTGSTELNVDGAATTFAAMRALTPKAIRNDDFGTVVFE